VCGVWGLGLGVGVQWGAQHTEKPQPKPTQAKPTPSEPASRARAHTPTSQRSAFRSASNCRRAWLRSITTPCSNDSARRPRDNAGSARDAARALTMLSPGRGVGVGGRGGWGLRVWVGCWGCGSRGLGVGVSGDRADCQRVEGGLEVQPVTGHRCADQIDSSKEGTRAVGPNSSKRTHPEGTEILHR